MLPDRKYVRRHGSVRKNATCMVLLKHDSQFFGALCTDRSGGVVYGPTLESGQACSHGGSGALCGWVVKDQLVSCLPGHLVLEP